MRVDAGDRVLRQGDVQVADVRVQGGVQHALFGDLAGQHHGAHAQLPQEVGEGCVVEDRVPGLEDEQGLVVRPDRLDQGGEGGGQRGFEELGVVGAPQLEVVVELDQRYGRVPESGDQTREDQKCKPGGGEQ